EVGALTETVTVEASVAQIQTQSAERAGVVTGRQVVDIQTSQRNFLDIVRTVPGIVYTGGLGGIQANGNRGNQNNFTLDGVNAVDTGSNGGTHTNVNLDAIGEFKIITNSQPAEFGRSSGAAINVVTKSGSRDFHGTGYWFYRHDSLNANTWRNNFEGRARQRRRQNWAGYNIGGPVRLPFTDFNKNRDKLFFFVAQEWQRQLVPNALRNVTVPTALERQGNFSQTREGDGSPLILRDPLNGNTQFPNNTIPQNRITSDGQKILNFYPLPNRPGVDPTFNFQSEVSHGLPVQQTIVRGDYNISDKWRLFSRYVRDARQQNMPYGQWNADFNLPLGPMNFGDPGWSFITNVTTIVNPSLTNEFIFGTSKNVLNIDPTTDTWNRAPLNLSYRMPFQNADTLGLIQNWRFGGVPNAPFTGFNGTPFRNFNHIYEFTDNIAKVYRNHTFKTGLYIHYSMKDQTAFTSVNGNIWFDRDGNNPGDTNWAFGNALVGNYQRVQQSNIVLNGMYRNYNVEWYFQDTWKVSRKLTLDLGMRWYWVQPQHDAADQTSSFRRETWDDAARGILVQPFRNPAGAIVGRNPVTGELTPRALVGSLVPRSAGYVNGLFANGMAREGQPGTPQGLIQSRGIHWAPRLGVAYNFMEKTVLRAGAGMFYDRFQGNPVFDMLPNPPSTQSPTFFYGGLADLANARGVFFPQNVRGFAIEGKVPTTYNWNLSIQRELPSSILLDIGYVGSTSRNNLAIYDYNMAPFGSAWLPQNQDPTNANPQNNGRTTLPVNFYRPYVGFGETRVTCFCTSSNYHSLQVGATRRLNRGLTFGLAYTWSKAQGVASGDGDTLHPTNSRVADYGPLFFDRTHNLVLNYVWDLPKAGRGGNFLDNPVGRMVFNGWTLAGVTQWISGQPDNIGLSIQGLGGADVNRIYTGSENYGPRVRVSGNPELERSKRSQDGWINTSVFAIPLVGSQGFDSAPRLIRRPGDYVWDMSVYKNIPLGAESRFIQLRVEMFNAFNQVRFSDFNRTATFNQQGVLTNLPTQLGGTGGRFGFGAITGTRDPRIIQLAAKIYF
ncbi:MAG TPA: hypothetical protein DEH78_06935, partial [Solibacterales bacterium]|nr:hypothetical protein [Bryobacterales bacterium]